MSAKEDFQKKFRHVSWGSSYTRQMFYMMGSSVAHRTTLQLRGVYCRIDGESIEYEMDKRNEERFRDMNGYDRIDHIDEARKIDNETNYYKLLWPFIK